VFDEIDTGVGGAVADAIGQRLARLAARAPVLAVTHAPQVAARSQRHFKIVKHEVGEGVATRVMTLSAAERREEIARMLAGEVTRAGGEVRTGATVTRVRREGGSVRLELASEPAVEADRAIVCAGLHADRLARASGESADPRIVPFRGEYWKLDPEKSALLRGLVYPVPDPALPFLGVHLTRKLDGSIWLGPNAVMALAREGYSRRDVNPRDVIDALRWPGTWRMMRRHWRAGAGELRRSLIRSLVVREARRYVPALGDAPITPVPAGVRAQAIGLDGSLLDDFRLSDPGPIVWVRNAPSPGATSALAIAEELVARALG